jgi:hypothetical protein
MVDFLAQTGHPISLATWQPFGNWTIGPVFEWLLKDGGQNYTNHSKTGQFVRFFNNRH